MNVSRQIVFVCGLANVCMHGSYADELVCGLESSGAMCHTSRVSTRRNKFRDLGVGETDVFLESFVKDLARLVFALKGSTRAQVASELEVHAAALRPPHTRLDGVDYGIETIDQFRCSAH